MCSGWRPTSKIGSDYRPTMTYSLIVQKKMNISDAPSTVATKPKEALEEEE